jgi:hypothetical protein
VSDCITLLNQLARQTPRNKITLRWIPGHSGFPGNEQADHLARNGSSGSLMGPSPAAAIPHSVISHGIKSWVARQHLTRWENTNNCRQSKKAIPRPTQQLRKVLLRLPRSSLSAICMAFSGHGCFTRHRFLQGKTTDETCPFCRSGIENAEHFLCDCPIFTKARLAHLGPNPNVADLFRPENP